MKIRAQGEIFGVALFFVIVVIGVVVFAQFRALNPDNTESDIRDERYKVLSESALSSILDLSTGCEVFRGKDSLADLIEYCVDYSFGTVEPTISCEGVSPDPVDACTYSVEFLNNSLFGVLNTSEVLGPIPYRLQVFSEASLTPYGELNLSNMDGQGFKYGERFITKDNYLQNRFKRSPPGLKILPTSQRSVTFELYMYYR